MATEHQSLEWAREQLAEDDAWVGAVMRRLASRLPARPLTILDVGAAQGRGVITLHRQGHDAWGVEPWKQALDIAATLADEQSMPLRVREGAAEDIPFQDGTFDLVLAFGVMEHVTDLEASLSEIHRVLKPGGVFWFYSASGMCPRQGEIRGFPMFGWYPDRLKKRIMVWSRDHRPELVAHTKTPAMHWWTPWNARSRLRAVGFDEVWDRWDLRLLDECAGAERAFVRGAKRVRPLRHVGDVLKAGAEYAARKPAR